VNISECKTTDLTTAEPFKSLFSAGSNKVRDAVAAAMTKNGYDPAFPIVAWNGVVVDGHTRLAASKLAKLKMVYFVDHQFTDEAEALSYAIACQRNRRNLTDAELLRCVAELDKRKDKTATLKRGDSMPDPQGCGTGESAAATAATLGISQRKVEQIRTVLDHATPEVKAAVESGELSTNAAYKATQESRKGDPEPSPAPKPGTAMCHAAEAIACMRKIKASDPARSSAFAWVRRWLNDHEEP
jgi:ParB family chromosome partitioning protein